MYSHVQVVSKQCRRPHLRLSSASHLCDGTSQLARAYGLYTRITGPTPIAVATTEQASLQRPKATLALFMLCCSSFSQQSVTSLGSLALRNITSNIDFINVTDFLVYHLEVMMFIIITKPAARLVAAKILFRFFALIFNVNLLPIIPPIIAIAAKGNAISGLK